MLSQRGDRSEPERCRRSDMTTHLTGPPTAPVSPAGLPDAPAADHPGVAAPRPRRRPSPLAGLAVSGTGGAMGFAGRWGPPRSDLPSAPGRIATFEAAAAAPGGQAAERPGLGQVGAA